MMDKKTDRTKLLDKVFRNLLKNRIAYFTIDQLKLVYENICFIYIKDQRQLINMRNNYFPFENKTDMVMDTDYDDGLGFQKETENVMDNAESDEESIYFSCTEDDDGKGNEGETSEDILGEVGKECFVDEFDLVEIDQFLKWLGESEKEITKVRF